MKHFFKKLSLLGLLFAGSVLFIIFLLTKLYSSDQRPLPLNQKMLMDKYCKKTSAIVLLGGSNVAYGFNSEILHDSLGMSVINTSGNINLGLEFMLKSTSTYLTDGDVLVIAPEYNHFYNDFAYGGSPLAEAFYTHPSIITNFDDIRQFKAIIIRTGEIPIQFLMRATTTKEAPSHNDYGDYTGHWNMPPRSFIHLSPYNFRTINTDFLDYYEKAVADLRSRGVQVIVIPPAFPETSYRNTEEKLLPLFSEFDRRGLSFSIPPQESVYPDSLFFDSPYHLVYEGVIIRTGQLLQLLKSRL